MSFSAGKNLQNNVNVTEAQTLQNKTIDSTNTVNDAPINNSTVTGASLVSPTRADVKKDTQANLETYAATATEGQLVYATDTKTMYQIKNNALSEVSGGAGGVNYIENSDAEINTDGWSTYDDGAVDTPVDGTGGSPAAMVFNRNTTTPLRGTADFEFLKDVFNAQGEGASYDFTIDKADQAKKLTISFDYDASDPNYVDDYIKVYVYDVTNSRLIRVNGEGLKGGKGTHYAQFQTSADSTSYRLILHMTNTTTDSFSVFFDNIKVGPREVAYGTLVTDWESYTPTNTQGFGTISSSQFQYKRVGDSMHIQAKFTAGTLVASEAQIELPNSLTIKSDVELRKVGEYYSEDTTGGFEGAVLATGGDSFLNFSSSVETADHLLVANGNALGGSNDRFSFYAQIPIQGWSSNSISSEDLGGREIVVEAEGSSQGSVATGTSITFATEIKDTTASFDGTTFIVPESGEYLISASCGFTSGVQVLLQIEVNGTDVREFRSTANGGAGVVSGSSSLSLIKGDTVEIVLSDSDSSSINILNTARQTNLSIQKLASPQTILETETVAARYTSNSGQTIDGTQSVIEYEDLDYDTHNAYNTLTGEYTVPVSGIYDIKAQWSITANDQEQLTTNIVVDGSVTTYVRQQGSRNAALYAIQISDKLKLEKGQVITITGATSGGSTPLNTSGIYNNFSIARIK